MLQFYHFIFSVILLGGCTISTSLADKNVKNLNDQDSFRWILDTERTSGDLGNAPDSNCIKVFLIPPQGEGIQSCINKEENIADYKNHNQQESMVQVNESQNEIIIGKKNYKLTISPDRCFMVLSDMSASGNQAIEVYKREPAPTGCSYN